MKNEKVMGIYQRGGVSCDHIDDRIFYVARDLFLHYSDHPRPDCRLLGNADDRQLTLSEVKISNIFISGSITLLLKASPARWCKKSTPFVIVNLLLPQVQGVELSEMVQSLIEKVRFYTILQLLPMICLTANRMAIF